MANKFYVGVPPDGGDVWAPVKRRDSGRHLEGFNSVSKRLTAKFFRSYPVIAPKNNSVELLQLSTRGSKRQAYYCYSAIPLNLKFLVSLDQLIHKFRFS